MKVSLEVTDISTGRFDTLVSPCKISYRIAVLKDWIVEAKIEHLAGIRQKLGLLCYLHHVILLTASLCYDFDCLQGHPSELLMSVDAHAFEIHGNKVNSGIRGRTVLRNRSPAAEVRSGEWKQHDQCPIVMKGRTRHTMELPSATLQGNKR